MLTHIHCIKLFFGPRFGSWMTRFFWRFWCWLFCTRRQYQVTQCDNILVQNPSDATNHWFFHSIGSEAWIANRKASTFFKEPNCKATRHRCGWAFEVVLQWRWGAQRWHNEMLPFGRISFLWLNYSIDLNESVGFATLVQWHGLYKTWRNSSADLCKVALLIMKQAICVWGVYRTCQTDAELRQSRPRPLRGWRTLLAWLVLPLSRILDVIPASGQLFTYLGRLTFLDDLHAPPFHKNA